MKTAGTNLPTTKAEQTEFIQRCLDVIYILVPFGFNFTG